MMSFAGPRAGLHAGAFLIKAGGKNCRMATHFNCTRTEGGGSFNCFPLHRLDRRSPFSAMSQQEQNEEKARVAGLSSHEKETELRTLDKEIARLNTLRGINTGELYTIRGKFKALARDYGIGFVVWYWTVWSSTAVLTYASIKLGNVDAIALIGKLDGWTGYDISSKVDPTVGTIGLALAVNELLEPLRLPFVVFTTKPVVEFFSKKSY